MGMEEGSVGTTAAAQCLEHCNHLLVRTRKRAAVLRICWGGGGGAGVVVGDEGVSFRSSKEETNNKALWKE